jgi:hypothetical protein
MDIVELAERWLAENKRQFYCAQMDRDEIAIFAYCAGYKAAQKVYADGGGNMYPYKNGLYYIEFREDGTFQITPRH